MEKIKIDGRAIGPGEPVYIIAEAGVNHNGDVNIALELIKEAKKAGADCVKFQTFKAERVVTATAPKAKYQLEVTDRNESQLDMLRALELQEEDYRKIIAYARELGITVISTPYSKEDADFLENLDVPAFKIASGQLIELSFLQYVARKGRPVILSTGMGSMAEVCEAVEAIRETGNEQLILLQCTTNYPSDPADTNLRAMQSMGVATEVMMGYSDHVAGNVPCFASVALGATVVEKHFTLDTSMPGPDHSSSLDPRGFEELVQGIRTVSAAMGSGIKKPTFVETQNMTGMRRSIVAADDLAAGTVLTEDMLTFKRPATGTSPARLAEFLGKTLQSDLRKDQFLMPDQVK